MKKIISLAASIVSISVSALPTYEPFTEYAAQVTATPTNSLDLCTAGLIAPSGEQWTLLNFSATAGTNVPGVDILLTNSPGNSLFSSTSLSSLLPTTFPGYPGAGSSISTYVVNPAQPLGHGATGYGSNPNIVGNSAVLKFGHDFTRPASGTKTLFVSYLFAVAQPGQAGNGNNGRYLGFLESTNLVEGTGTSGYYKTWASLFNTFGTTEYAAHGVRYPNPLDVGPTDSYAGPVPAPISALSIALNSPAYVVGEIVLVSTNASATGTHDTNILWLNPSPSNFGGPTPPTTQEAVYVMTNVAMSDIGGMVLIDRVGSGGLGGVGTNYMANLMLGNSWSFVTGGPEFTNQPANASTNYGSTLTLSTAATAASQTVSYQWQIVTPTTTNIVNNGSGGAGGAATVSGANTSTLTLAGISAADLGTYQVVATASGTGFSLASSNVIVSSDPLITSEPQNASAALGGSAVFSTAASTQFGSLTYQWNINGAPLANGTQPDGSIIEGATTATLSLSNFQIDENGATITCAVTNGVSSGEISGSATINLADPAITAQPSPVTTNYGATVSFTASAQTSAGHAPLSYAWYKGSTMLSNGSQPGGSTATGAQGTGSGTLLTSTLTLANVSYQDDGTYSLAVTNTADGTISTIAVPLTVTDPYITAQPPTVVEVATGGTTTLAVGAVGSGLSYQWYSSNIGQLPDGGDFSGVTTPDLTISTAQAADAGTYYLVITGANDSLQSSNVAVYVDTAVSSVSISPSTLTQQAGTHLAFVAGYIGGTGGLVNLEWQLNGTPLSDGTQHDGSAVFGSSTTTLILSNVQPADSGTYTVTAYNASGTNSLSGTLNVTAGLLPLFTNNLVVTRIGEGSETLSGATGNTLYLDQFTTNGGYVSTIMVPDNGPAGIGGGNVALLVPGAGADGQNEAYLTLSSNQQFLNFAGYCWNYPFSGGPDVTVAINASGGDIRGIGAVNAAGTFIMAYTNYGLYSAGEHFLRSAYSTDGLTNFWTTGAAGGTAIKYVNAGPAGAAYKNGQGVPGLSYTTNGPMVIGLAGPNLVFSDAETPNTALSFGNPICGIDIFGGAPTSAPAAPETTNLVNIGSPADFAFSPDLKTLYLADSGPSIAGGTGYGGGVQRWDLIGGAYTYEYNLEDATGVGTNGVRGLTAYFPPNGTGWGQGVSGAVVYATTSEMNSNRLIQFIDNQGVNSTATVVATAGPNQFLRGVRFGPTPTPVTFVAAPQSLISCPGNTATFSALVAGDLPLGFQWQSNGVNIAGFSQTTIGANVESTLTLSNIQTNFAATYSVVVTNQFMTNSAQATLTVPSSTGAPTLISDVYPLALDQPVGETAVFTVMAGCNPSLVYQWQLNGTNLVDNGHVIGSQTDSLTISNTQLSDSGNYQLVLSDPEGTNYSSVATLTVTLVDFNNGGGWSLNGGATMTNGILTLTDGGGNEFRSTFLDEPVDVTAFLASWTYMDVTGGGAADGVVFVVQNAPAGTAALGQGGGALAYIGITNSVGLEFNIFGSYTIGIAVGTNGVGPAGPYFSTSPVNLTNGDPIGVSLEYLNGLATVTLTDAVASVSFTTNFAINVPATVGSNTAYVGFTGADGGVSSVQVISNFFFTSLPVIAVQNGGEGLVVLTWPAAAPGFTLQKTSSLSAPNWVNVTNVPIVVGSENQVTLTPTGAPRFYRLIIQ